MDKQIFYFTFGQAHHLPFNDEFMLADYWVRIEAKDELAARHCMYSIFGVKWSHCYPEKDFNPEYFPKGDLMKIEWKGGMV